MTQDIRGTPWRPIPHKTDTRIPIHISEDIESAGEEPDEPEDHICVINDEEAEPVDIPQNPDPKPRVFAVKREDISKYGATDKRRGCTAIAREWKRHFAHSSACRERIMSRVLEDGDPDGRVKAATERSLREGALEQEFAQFIDEKVKIGRRSAKDRFIAGRERNIQSLMDKKMEDDLRKLMTKQIHQCTCNRDLASNAFEKVLLKNALSEIHLESELEWDAQGIDEA